MCAGSRKESRIWGLKKGLCSNPEPQSVLIRDHIGVDYLGMPVSSLQTESSPGIPAIACESAGILKDTPVWQTLVRVRRRGVIEYCLHRDLFRQSAKQWSPLHPKHPRVSITHMRSSELVCLIGSRSGTSPPVHLHAPMRILCIGLEEIQARSPQGPATLSTRL